MNLNLRSCTWLVSGSLVGQQRPVFPPREEAERGGSPEHSPWLHCSPETLTLQVCGPFSGHTVALAGRGDLGPLTPVSVGGRTSRKDPKRHALRLYAVSMPWCFAWLCAWLEDSSHRLSEGHD
jgi:hypothetical protein